MKTVASSVISLLRKTENTAESNRQTAPSSRQIIAAVLLLAMFLPLTLPVPARAYEDPTPEQQFAAKILESAESESSFGAIPSFAKSPLASPLAALNNFFGDSGGNKNNELKAKEAEKEIDKEALAGRVKKLDVQLDENETIKKGQILSLAALPLDNNDNPVDGLIPEWRSSNPEIIKVIDKFQAIAINEGTAVLSVRAGNTEHSVQVIVKGAEQDKSGANTIRENQENDESISESKSDATNLENESSSEPASNASASSLNQPWERPILPESEQGSLTSPENNLGTPPYKTEPGAPSMASAIGTRERPGIENYSFGIPVASLPGRGTDVNLGVTYNSRVWNKSVNSAGNHFTFNVDGNWLSPGFQLGYGYLDLYNTTTSNSLVILTDPDGTRHELRFRQFSGFPYYVYIWESTDGTFVGSRLYGQRPNQCEYDPNFCTVLILTYPNGTEVQFGAVNQQNRRFPTKITDVNGNQIEIFYLENDQTGKISHIIDTLGRYITFHYDNTTERKLVAVSVPGFGDNAERRQTIRFYYEDLTLQLSCGETPSSQCKFNGSVTAPTTPFKVLRYVYFPGTRTGYKYDYSPYFGMVHRIWQLRNMQINLDVNDPSSLQQTGSVISEGQWAAWTRYNYPASQAELPAQQLTDVPKYNARTDDWQGRTTQSIAQTSYDINEEVNSYGVGTRTTSITTSPDNTVNKSVAVINPGQWDDGLIKETSITATVNGSPATTKQVMKYLPEQDIRGNQTPRLKTVETTNELNQTKATTFEHDGYNNITKTREYDFAAPGTLGTELRRTETIYETRSQWTINRLFSLPTSVKVIVNNTIVSRTDYEYDNYNSYNGGYSLEYAPASQRSAFHDPYTNETVMVCIEWDYDGNCINQEPRSIYDPQTDYRGNVTKVTQYSNAAVENDPNASVTKMGYDTVGNVVKANVNCCQLKTWTYGHNYAYPIEQRRGANGELVSTVAYDVNTGLVKSSTDENNQQTSYVYEPSSLRLERTNYPNGGYVATNYHDELSAGANGKLLSYVETTTKLDNYRSVSSRQYMDGRGAVVRTFGPQVDGVYQNVQDVEYDELGRIKQSSNPYTATSFTSAVNPSGKWKKPTYDGFGRTTEVTLQDGTKIKTSFNHAAVTVTYPNNRTVQGTATTVTDQAGKQRRNIADALGRSVRVDEPNSSGLLDGGNVNAPYQPTFYSYDGNGNLTEVIQKEAGSEVTQTRKFVYDGLSRLIREKQPEAAATLNDAGVKQTSPGAGEWSAVYKYDTFGNLDEGIDARGVKTKFTYEQNKLNRLKQVEYYNEVNYRTPTVTYTYGDELTGAASSLKKGRIAKVQTARITDANQDTPETSQSYDYDAMGQVTAQTQTVGGYVYNLQYGYNLAGQLVKETYPSGKVVEYEIDAAGRLAKVFDQRRTYASGFEYKPYGALAAVNLGNGTREENSFDEASGRLQLTQQKLLKGATVLEQYNYAYGQVDLSNGAVDASKNNGQLAKVESYFAENSQNTKQWEQRFGYDELGRISQVQEHLGSNIGTQTYKHKFNYDRFGNQYRNGNEQSGAVLPRQITESTNATGDNGEVDKKTNRFTNATGIVYDEAGNVTRDTKFRAFNYRYDANGRMVRAERNDVAGTVRTSVYDASGQRVATKTGDTWKIVVYDVGGKMIAEYGGTPSQTSSGVQYLFTDWQGSTRTITDAAGIVKGRLDYTAFGEEVGAGVGNRTSAQGYTESNVRNRYALTERDETTGLDHTWWRKNENKAGRWTSPDPYSGSMNFGDPQSFNRYSYANNDPVNLIDPSGLNADYSEGGWVTCVRYHYYNPSTGEGFWGAWTCTSSGGSAGMGGGPGMSSNSQNNSQKKPGPKTIKFCTEMAKLLQNEVVKKAIDEAWNQSVAQNPNREIGGVIDIRTKGQAGGGGDSIGTLYNLPARLGTSVSLPGFTEAVLQHKENLKQQGGYFKLLFWYHTHPANTGDIIPLANGTSVQAGDVTFPSLGDRNTSRALGVPGLAISPNGISVFDNRGRRCFFPTAARST